MKIEIGESLFYSWLRHVKGCQIVQNNWRTSTQWPLLHRDALEEMKAVTERHFREKYGYEIYKKTSSLSQLLRQAECDAFGLCVQSGVNRVFSVDVAFHEGGINYGGREATVQKIVAKCLRTAMCVYGYLDTREAEIIFASPRITRSVLEDVTPCLEEAQKLLDDLCFHFRLRIIANDGFREEVLEPVLRVSGEVADTNELFLRSHHMLQMFDDRDRPKREGPKPDDVEIPPAEGAAMPVESSPDEASHAGLKIGRLVQTVLRKLLQSDAVSADEIERMQTASYSKAAFDLQYPLLVRQDGDYNRVRYYKDPVSIRGVSYMICSQWYETPTNNDRPYLMKWIGEHQEAGTSMMNPMIPREEKEG